MRREVIMRKLFLAPVLLSLAVLSCLSTSRAQVSPRPPGSTSKDAPAGKSEAEALPPGTVLSVELSKSLDAKKSKAEARVEARTAIDLLVHGQIVVPRNTKIMGRVTEAKAHSKTSPGSLLGISFERMLLKDGREVPLQATVQAIARPLQLNYLGNDSNPAGDMASGIPSQRPTSAGDSTAPSIPPRYPTSTIPEPPGLNVPNTSTVSPLAPTSRGVIGIKGLSLETSGSVSVLTSNTGNVHLDSGTQLMLRVQ